MSRRYLFHYRLAQVLIRAGTRSACGFRCEGTGHLPTQGACLLAANHKSYLDPLVIGAAVSRPICYFAKKQLFRIPLFGPLIHSLGAIPVDREGFSRDGVETALGILQRGEVLVVFPEGTRIRRPGLAAPKVGIGLLALRTGTPVVPVHIAGTWEPRRSWRRRMPVTVRLGPPLVFPRLPAGPEARARYPEIAEAVMEAIAALAPQK